MKCTNCGKNEVNYYYRTNINGAVKEECLCSECAAKLGKTGREAFGEMDKMWNEVMGEFFGYRRSAFSPFIGFGMLPTMFMPFAPMGIGGVTQEREEKRDEKPAEEVAVDPAVSRRRELNMLKAQMSDAVKAEEFEKAAELRDKIRALESEN